VAIFNNFIEYNILPRYGRFEDNNILLIIIYNNINIYYNLVLATLRNRVGIGPRLFPSLVQGREGIPCYSLPPYSPYRAAPIYGHVCAHACPIAAPIWPIYARIHAPLLLPCGPCMPPYMAHVCAHACPIDALIYGPCMSPLLL